MHVWFITSGVAGSLTTGHYKTQAGILKAARKRLEDHNRLNFNQAEGVEVWIAPADSRPFYNPDSKPDFIVKA